MLHGLASSKECWALVAPLLASSARVICVDLPGHGASAPLDAATVTPTELGHAVEGLMDELGVERAHLVGNSLGGWVALEIAADGRAASVTAFAPAGLWNPFARRGPIISFNHTLARMVRPAIPSVLRIAPLRWALVSSGVRRPRALSYEVALDAALAQANAVGFHAAYDGVINRWFDRASHIDPSVPVSIAFGDRDLILNPRQCQRRELAPAHARWLTLWRCGHAPMYDVPTVCRDVICHTAGIETRSSVGQP